ncbi:MAG: hypothetical protein JSW45_00030 [Thiotrichales bacterium]|nr:MAG: hypothetical protein JSW45_00030 [Thiotrichales bacterium]
MKLHIPEQEAPAKDATPQHPRKLRKWLAGLPHANMGEMTRLIYSAVRDLNRQKMPNKYRIEDMELLRETVRNIFNNLEKHFINRTLPLPEKSQKIVKLNQSLLREMSYGYKIIVFQAANGVDKKVDAKTQNLAILRALRYMSELLLRASEIYEPCPAGTWYDIHQMYLYAEQQGFHTKPVADTEYESGKASIEDYYKQILLFSLARPTALRQSDTERVYKKLAHWAQLAKLGTEAEEHHVNRCFCARVDQDRPPNYLTMQDCDGTTIIRTIETSKLVDAIQAEIKNNQDNEGRLAVGDQFSTETLNVLAMSWGVCAKRRFSRADRDGHIKAVIGLVKAARTIAGIVEEEEQPAEDIKPGKRNQLNISLEAIPEDFKASETQVKSAYTTHHEIGSNPNDAWDMVAKGRVLTDAYEKEKLLMEDSQIRRRRAANSQWQIVNVSAGGYCLRWDSDVATMAQIGELIALCEKEPDGSDAWRIGVIRWMRYIRSSGLEIGVQVLSPKVLSASAQRRNRPNEEPFECLILPGIKPLKLPPSVLLPAHAFRPSDNLVIKFPEEDREGEDREMEIQLDSVDEHTGSFTQFQYTSRETVEKIEQERKKQAAAQNKDNFDEIWSSL